MKHIMVLLLCLLFTGVGRAMAEEPLAVTDQAPGAGSEVVEAPAEEGGTAPEISDDLGSDLSPWGMYQAADWVVKAVMILLVIASVLTWMVCLLKMLQLNVARRREQRFLAVLVEAERFAEAENKSASLKGSGLLLLQASDHELAHSARGKSSDGGVKERVSARLERVQVFLTGRMNRGTGILATVGSVAPFVGLFGTVWGIMNSFIGIAESNTTNLAVVAPGIAEALLATAMGLVAAIPAVVIYNHFSRAIGSYRALLADISTALLILVSRDLDRHHPEARALAGKVRQKETEPVSISRDVD
ncbi:MAG: tonB-system energizer ExbB [Marinobacter sp.]|uniref:tonB-system energizer ExbB n=1 Tax=Marinobacter sp. TaxID=50741 RepID=UPI003F9A73DB